jgi:hypothetical protein
VAIALVSTITYAGFEFGLFTPYTSFAQVTVTSVSLAGSSATPKSLGTVTCATSPSPDFIVLDNSGSKSTTVTGVTVTIANVSYSTTVTGQECLLGASGSGDSTAYLILDSPTLGSPGSPFKGYVSLSNGAHVPFTGVFY